VLSTEAWALVGGGGGRILPTGDVSVESLDLPAGEPPPPSVSEDVNGQLHGYISPAILDRILAGQRQWLAELRRVSVLFMQLPDVDLARRLDEGQRVIETLQTIIGR
jgi:hypothetical protein